MKYWVQKQPSGKKVFVEISQNLQENICSRFSFINNVAVLRNYGTSVFL